MHWLLRNWAVVLLAVGVGYFIYDAKTNHLHEQAKFTLGTIDGYRYTTNSGRFFNFSFDVAGRQYGGSSGWQAGMHEANGSPCLVEYDSLDPSQNAGHFGVPIPDTLRQAPRNGWRVPPFPVPAWLLDHGQ